ncbi:MAG: aldehyde dehydrogenase family protein [Mariprofundaceae bacterium]
MLAHKTKVPANSEPEAPHFYLWLNSEAREGMSAPLEITSPFDGMLVGTVSIAGRRQIREAISSSAAAFPQLKSMPRFQRSELLNRIVELLRDSRTELVDAMILEGGKPRMFAEQEFERTLSTFSWASEEVKRFCGEQIPMDGMSRGKGYEGHTIREPIGIVLAITPFNFPLNLVAHKLAPALACGNPVILKPASNTPITALILARIVSEAGFPAGSLNVLPMRHQDIPILLQSDDVKMVSFTGSSEVGWSLKQMAGKQRVTLELGGNSGTYVDDHADLEFAAHQLAMGGFAHAGQSCIAVQRIYAHKSIYEKLLSLLTRETKKIKSGNPQSVDVITGPLITVKSAERVLKWIQEAVANGAKVECGGKRLELGRGQVIEPTLLTHVKDSMQVSCKEIFGPVITLSPVSSCDEAIRRINRSDFGLQAAIFSHDIRNIQYATEHLEVGGVIINDFPTYRIDHMPYGGSKGSGLGREGIRSAMLEMSEEKMIVTRLSI